MQDHRLVYPMFVMVLLAASVLVRLFRARTAAVVGGAVDVRYFRTYQDGKEPESSATLARNFVNQFEAPVLFYAACVTAMALGLQSAFLLVLAWAYVLSRAVHIYVHTGKNRLRPRIHAYLSSWVILLLMWGTLVASVATR